MEAKRTKKNIPQRKRFDIDEAVKSFDKSTTFYTNEFTGQDILNIVKQLIEVLPKDKISEIESLKAIHESGEISSISNELLEELSLIEHDVFIPNLRRNIGILSSVVSH